MAWVSGLTEQQGSAIYGGGETEGQADCYGEITSLVLAIPVKMKKWGYQVDRRGRRKASAGNINFGVISI